MIHILYLLEPRFKHFFSILKKSCQFFPYYKEFLEIVKINFHILNYSKS